MTAWRRLPGARALAGYRSSWLPRDFVAGLVLVTLLVPQGMAYAELAGLPAITGLYASVTRRLTYAVAAGISHSGAPQTGLIWPANCRLRKPNVVVLACRAPLLVTEIRLFDGSHNGPMMADRAVLNSPPGQAERLERDSRNPDGREEVAIAAADDDVAANSPTPRPQGRGLEQDTCSDRGHTVSASRGPMFVRPATTHLSGSSTARLRPGE